MSEITDRHSPIGWAPGERLISAYQRINAPALGFKSHRATKSYHTVIDDAKEQSYVSTKTYQVSCSMIISLNVQRTIIVPVCF